MSHPTAPASPQTIEDLAVDPSRRAVDALTDAVTQPTPHGRPMDFADHLAHVLAAVAANVGGVDRLLAGRSGSWEAGLVAQLVEGTVGYDPRELWRHRTVPVVVPLHVAELVEDRYSLPGLDEARGRVDDRYDAIATPDPDDTVAYEADIAAVEAAWRAAYRAYGEAFARAVHDRAAQLAGLQVPVSVRVVDDPDAAWWRDLTGMNPHEDGGDGDALVFLLWAHATDVVPLPVDEHGHLTDTSSAHVGGER